MKQNYEIHEKPIIVNAFKGKIMRWKKWEYCVCWWIGEDQWLKSPNCKYMGWRVRGRLRRCQNENFEACTENKLPSEWMRPCCYYYCYYLPFVKWTNVIGLWTIINQLFSIIITGHSRNVFLYGMYSKSLIFVPTVNAVQF